MVFYLKNVYTNSDNSYLGDILDGDALMSDEVEESKNGNNFVCLLTSDDYDKLESNPWASFHAYIDYFESASTFKTSGADAEASKRYIRSGAGSNFLFNFLQMLLKIFNPK